MPFPPQRSAVRKLVLGLLVVAITGSGLPLVKVHAHADGAAAHHHDLGAPDEHAHNNLTSESAGDDGTTSTAEDAELLHAHAIGAQGIALMATPTIESDAPVYGATCVVPGTDRLPDKIPSVHFRPPIA